MKNQGESKKDHPILQAYNCAISYNCPLLKNKSLAACMFNLPLLFWHLNFVTHMTIYDFAFMDELSQLEAFWEGDFIGEKCNGGFVMMCRRLNNFYVEYKTLGGHYIDMNIFTNHNRLELYSV